MNSKVKSVNQLKTRLFLWPLLLLLSIFVVDISVETIDFCVNQSSYEEDFDTEFARRCSKVNKTGILSNHEDFPTILALAPALKISFIPSLPHFHSLTNFVRSGAKIAKELTSIP